ncbi:hypothetical protein D3C74_400880 [compost metagenome]
MKSLSNLIITLLSPGTLVTNPGPEVISLLLFNTAWTVSKSPESANLFSKVSNTFSSEVVGSVTPLLTNSSLAAVSVVKYLKTSNASSGCSLLLEIPSDSIKLIPCCELGPFGNGATP